MKKTFTIVKDWGTLVAFCTMIVIGMQIREDIKQLKAAVIEAQEFQQKQSEMNAKESIVYNWALQKLLGTEIHEIPEENEEGN